MKRLIEIQRELQDFEYCQQEFEKGFGNIIDSKRVQQRTETKTQQPSPMSSTAKIESHFFLTKPHLIEQNKVMSRLSQKPSARGQIQPRARTGLDRVSHNFSELGKAPHESSVMNMTQSQLNQIVSANHLKLTNANNTQSKLKSQKLSINEMAKMMKDISQASYGSSKGGNGMITFDLQTKRPEFVHYAPAVKPHDNRFLNINLDTLALSKNQRPKSLDFSKQLDRKSDYLVSKSQLDDNGTKVTQDDERELNNPYQYAKFRKYHPANDITKVLQKRMTHLILTHNIALRNYSIQMDKGLPRQFLVDEKKVRQQGGRQFTSEEIISAYNNQGHVTKGDPECTLPYFMQNYSNRQSLQLVLGKSLKESNFSNGQFIPQASSFKLTTNAQISQNNKKYRLTRHPTAIADESANKRIQNFVEDFSSSNINGSGQKKQRSKATTFYKLLQEGGYIKETVKMNKDRKRAWHISKIKSNLDSDFSSDSD
ncbi:UNKNOWN [Stylonychia lemnae]|uniref:Uncharacterized protein n=1 Tax=Stylonychia lemnae TaxID=5949 RepID=A0A078B4P4_STYLE|nr:UNKNOWN [Stylonychia lemnae]|eukprot:CDW89505.1 UNKNOWN [Stylonychia lemnae]